MIVPPVDVFALDMLRQAPPGLYGITGSAGSGKSAFATALGAAAGASVYSADFRFIGDSQHRRELLARKQTHSIEAYRDSANQFNWWDWGRIATDLQALESGVSVDIEEAYDRNTGRADKSRHVAATAHVIFEGAILGPSPLLARLKTLLFLCTPVETRFARLLAKDRARRSFTEIAARFLITELSETVHYRYLFATCDRKLIFIDAATGQPCEAPSLAQEGFVPMPTRIG